MWGARVRVQVFKRKFHTQIHLDYAKIEFLSCNKKKMDINSKCLFGFFFLVTHHSISVTHHLSLKIPHLVWHHHSLLITQYFSTVCEPHTCHLVRVKRFCGPHHFLFSHFPSFTPVTLPKHKPEPIFNHNNKNSNNNNNKMRPIRRLIPPPPQLATTG